MNKKLCQLAFCFIVGIGVQAGAYLYMDWVLFAPLSSGDYDMSDVKDKVQEAAEKEGKKLYAKVSVKGKAYYSHDFKYMADVTQDSVTIYKADDLNNPQKVDLKNQGVSFFEWMPDRNLALMALYPIHWSGGRWDVTLARYNPDGTTHESDAPIRDLPRNAKIFFVPLMSLYTIWILSFFENTASARCILRIRFWRLIVVSPDTPVLSVKVGMA